MKIEYIILKTANFIVCTLQMPHIDRNEGGHIVIACRDNTYANMEDIPPQILHEFIDLAVACGRHMREILAEEKIDIGIINYQVNGNWSALNHKRDVVHMHLYGRAKQAKKQTYGSALYLPDLESGFYAHNRGLKKFEIEYMRKRLLADKTVQCYLDLENET